MAPLPPPPTFLAFLRDNEFLNQAQVNEISRSAAAQSGDVRSLAKDLMNRGWLSAYQVNQLLQGKPEELVAGPFRILDRLGEGPTGAVFKARQPPEQRLITLKLIPPTKLPTPDVANRFYQYVTAVQQLQHPNVRQTLRAFSAGELHTIIGEYVEGTDLAKLVQRSGPLPFPKACDCIRQAALGLQAVHERGLVHRDIKPSNLVLSQPGAGGGEVVKILDLAQATIAAPGLNPDCAAPEFTRNPQGGDIRSDLYSLGCVFYFLLTGRPPFQDAAPNRVFAKHQSEDPVPVTTLRSDVPPAIQSIIRRLMAKRPEERFQTPGELASVLEPFARAPTLSPRLSPTSRSAPGMAPARGQPPRLPAAKKRGGFRKVMLGIVGIFLAVAVGLAALSPQINPFLRNRAPAQDDSIAQAADPAAADSKPADASDPGTQLKADPGSDPKLPTDPGPKVEPKVDPKVDPKPAPQADVAALTAQLKDKDPIARLRAARELAKLGPAARGAVPALKESLQDPDEDVVTAVKRAIATIGEEPPVNYIASFWARLLKDKDPILRLKAARELAKLGAGAKEAMPALQEALKDEDPDVQVAVRRAIQAISGETGAATEPTGAVAALMKQLTDKDALVRIKAARELGKLGPAAKEAVPALTDALKDSDEDVRSVAKRSLDQIQGTADTKPPVNPALAGIVKGLQSKTVAEKAKAAGQLAALGEKGREATSALLESMMEVWPNEKEAFLDALEKVDPKIHSPILTLLIDRDEQAKYKALINLGKLGADGKHAVPVLVKGCQANIPDPQGRRESNGGLLIGALDAMSKVAPEDKSVAQAVLAVMKAPSIDGRGYLQEAMNFNVPQNWWHSRIFALLLARKLKIAPSATVPVLLGWLKDDYGLVAIQELGKIGPEAKAAIPALNQLRFADDQKVREAAIAALKSIQAAPAPKPTPPDTKSRPNPGEPTATLQGHESWVMSLDFSPDGKTLASGGSRLTTAALGTIKLWDVASGKNTSTMQGHSNNGRGKSLVFSPDGKTLASSYEREIRLWEVATGNNTATLKWEKGTGSCLAFSPDGKTLASGGGFPEFIRLWAVATGKNTVTFLPRDMDSGHVLDLAFSPDGKTLALAHAGNAIWLWEVATGVKRATLGAGESVAFSPDGKTLAAIHGLDINLWEVATRKVVVTLVHKAEKNPKSVAFSPNGKTLASGCNDGTELLWDVASGKSVFTLEGHTYAVWCVAFSPDGKTLASGSRDMTIKLWEVSNNK